MPETAKIVREALAVPADLSKVSGVKAAVRKIKALVPTVDVLANDAATATRRMTPEAKRVFALSCKRQKEDGIILRGGRKNGILST